MTGQDDDGFTIRRQLIWAQYAVRLAQMKQEQKIRVDEIIAQAIAQFRKESAARALTSVEERRV